ncbi:ABC transporter permease [Mobilicoccus caccae]|uniref:Transport permease protein n=1 Tax=Mobilicoccus caccae TaxID=1859295 RepID=A0ABQ6IX68_9MICO|nr:ABC transporter permease [Mobilicoccus caccae]GMA41732.1 transport permease protein [Mobilicoccus caccae]
MLTDVLRNGLSRGIIEFRQSFGLVFHYLFFPMIALVVMYFLRGIDVQGSSLGSYSVPGILAMNIVFTGVMGLATNLIAEREDGTLMRAKSIPYGIHSYLVGKVGNQIALTVLTFAFVLVVAAIMYPDLLDANLRNTVSLLWLLPLGLMATLPFGAILGSSIRNPRNLSFVSLGLMGLVSVSGVFYPLAGQPQWMQVAGQCSPIYWLGLAIRSTMLNDAAVAAEIGQSWWTAQIHMVLGAWSFIGVLLAVFVLRRGARRQAGSRIPRQIVRAERLPDEVVPSESSTPPADRTLQPG